jgi:hypothetical protein
LNCSGFFLPLCIDYLRFLEFEIGDIEKSL